MIKGTPSSRWQYPPTSGAPSAPGYTGRSVCTAHSGSTSHPGSTGDPQSAPSDGAGRSLLPAVRGVAERGRRLLSPGSPPLLPEPGHRRIPKVASRSSALPLPFLPLRVGAHLPTPSRASFLGILAGHLVPLPATRWPRAQEEGAALEAESMESGLGVGLGGFEPPILATLDRRHGLLCFPSKLLEEVQG